MKIILAQGNPGRQYAKTRHNIGFLVLDELAKSAGSKWKTSSKFNSDIAELETGKIILVKPQSYYNETGQVARKIIDFYKVNPLKDLLVIHDDLALPLGTIRVRERGSDAGNNGIKSINTHIGDSYARVRIGIANDGKKFTNDIKVVLGKFSWREQKTLKEFIIPEITTIVKEFMQNSLKITSIKK